jgi:adenylylsulfate kinase
VPGVEQDEPVAALAELLAAHGIVPVLALVAPFAADRALARRRFAEAGWIEVFLDPPRDVCLERDSHGLYKALAARGGRALVDAEVLDLYEPPADAELRLDTSRVDVDGARAQIVDLVLAAQRRSTAGRSSPTGAAHRPVVRT